MENLNEREKELFSRFNEIGMMERDSEKVTENLELLLKTSSSKLFNDRVTARISYYTFGSMFSLTQKHFNIAVGIRIRKLRERLKISIEEFTYQIGYEHSSQVRYIEKGKANVSTFTLVKITNYFGVKTEELMYGRPETREINPKEINSKEIEYIG